MHHLHWHRGPALNASLELPTPDIVHLWTFALQVQPQYRELLTADELARAERFHFDLDKQRFVAGRARLRAILGSYLNQHPASLVFQYGPFGKPDLPGPLSFNISHSLDFAALAVARFAVGVDVEHIRSFVDDVAEGFFADDEVARLRSLPQVEQPSAFFACWTRKEAYVKALGKGLSMPLDRFSVSLEPREPARLLRADNDPAEPSRWLFHSFEVTPDIIGCVAARQKPWGVQKFSC